MAEKEFDDLIEEAKKFKEEKAKEKEVKPEEKAEKAVKEGLAVETEVSKVITPEMTVSEETIEFLRSKAEKEGEPLRNLAEASIEGIKADLLNPRVSVWVTGVRDDGDVAMHVFPTENNIRKTFKENGVLDRLPEQIKDTLIDVVPKQEKSWFDVVKGRKIAPKIKIKEKGE